MLSLEFRLNRCKCNKICEGKPEIILADEFDSVTEDELMSTPMEEKPEIISADDFDSFTDDELMSTPMEQKP